jgi:hypothetical protein
MSHRARLLLLAASAVLATAAVSARHWCRPAPPSDAGALRSRLDELGYQCHNEPADRIVTVACVPPQRLDLCQ